MVQPDGSSALPQDFIVLALQEFGQESGEKIDETEAALLRLEKDPANGHQINTVFRAIHTIKGSAGLFGLGTLEDFCHLTETMLHTLRAGERRFSSEIGTLLLQCNDHIRSMVRRGCAEQPLDAAELQKDRTLSAALTALMTGAEPSPSPANATTAEKAGPQPAPADAPEQQAASGTVQLRIDAERLDHIIALLGELSIAQSAATARAEHHQDPVLAELQSRVSELANDIHQSSLEMRMVPIGDTLNRFNRVVRDLASNLGKEVVLEVRGGQTELDKTLVDKITDPLTHLVRNALDHGLETPEQRRIAGKSARGHLLLHAWHEANSVVLRIEDDGRGLDRARIVQQAIASGLIAPEHTLNDQSIVNLIFSPGFSTAAEVTRLSGRGVGMDVVKSNIEALRGSIQIGDGAEHGMRVDLRLPLTLASFEGFMVKVAGCHFVLPLQSVQEIVKSTSDPTAQSHQAASVELRGQLLPLLRLRQLFKLQGPAAKQTSIVMVQTQGVTFGIEVDALLGQQQTVLKPLGRLFSKLPGIAGSSLLGNGEIALVLDMPSLLACTPQAPR